jgi:thymidylate synthase (FAD)
LNEVNLISLSKPTAHTECHTAEQLVAYAARVSNPGNQANHETAPRLLAYLAKHKHWSPFEMVHITMEIKTTRDIARQILRHRSFAFQEFSQRYAEVKDDFILRDARLQDKTNRQNSVDVAGTQLDEQWKMKQAYLHRQIEKDYEWALENGIAKEQARAILPEGNTVSTLYMAGSLRSWLHYCELRMANGTQAEHMDVAKKCWDIIKTHFPALVDAIDLDSEN